MEIQPSPLVRMGSKRARRSNFNWRRQESGWRAQWIPIYGPTAFGSVRVPSQQEIPPEILPTRQAPQSRVTPYVRAWHRAVPGGSSATRKLATLRGTKDS